MSERNNKWHKFLSKFHVYGGLFSVGFLLAFAYSGLVHQHHPKFAEPKEKNIKSWEAELNIPEIEDNQQFKLAVRDSLGFFGHAPWWKDYKDSLGIHHFMISRPAKEYWITVPSKGNTYKIDVTGTGILNLLNTLHPLAAGMQGAGKTPFFIHAWRIISVPMAVVLFLVVLISIYFWLKRSVNKKSTWLLIAFMAAVPVLLFILIWIVG